MPLSFLNPWFLLGTLAVAVPVWFHLRRKTETNLLRFSALRFLDDSPEPRQSPWLLRDLLLFCLRVLALLLLVGAFAWPYLQTRERTVVRESRVYILDNTLSHQARGRFLHSRDSIARDIRQAPADLQVAVIELTSQPRVQVAFADGREEAWRKVEALVPSFQRGSYLAAFRQAHALLAGSLGERQRIVFCTDSQQNQWTENLGTAPFLQDVPIEVRKPDWTNAPNVGLSEPRLQRVFLGDKSLVNFTANLAFSGEASSARLTLQANGQMIFSRSVDLTNRAGRILLQAQWEADPALWLQGVLAVEAQPDSLAGDNHAYFSLAPIREGKLALLALSPYLRLALSQEVMRGHWDTRLLDPARLGGELAAGRDAEVLVLESSYLASADARRLVERYLGNGRGVLLLVNRATPVVAAVLRDLGFETGAQSTLATARSEKFHYIFSSHPIFHPFLSPDYGNLLEVAVHAHAQLKPIQAMPLVFSEAGEALFFQGTRFPGKLFVTAFGLDRDQTSWPTHVTFIPFLDLCLQSARPEDPTPLDYEPGAVAVLNLGVDSTVREVVLRGSDGEVTRAAVSGDRTQFRLPDRPGLYTVADSRAAEPEKVLSVNPSPKESQLVFLDSPEALKLWRLDQPGDKPVEPPRVVAGKLALGAILQQQIWWWLLVAGLTALLLETLWTSWTTKPA